MRKNPIHAAHRAVRQACALPTCSRTLAVAATRARSVLRSLPNEAQGQLGKLRGNHKLETGRARIALHYLNVLNHHRDASVFECLAGPVGQRRFGCGGERKKSFHSTYILGHSFIQANKFPGKERERVF